MINAQPPIQPNTNPEARIVEGAGLPLNESALDHSSYGREYIRKILLRWLTNREINENESQEIVTGVSLYDFQRGDYILNHSENTEHFAASVNKLAITLLVLQDLRGGTTTLDQVLTWTEADRRDGAGVFDQPGSPVQATVREVLHDLLNRSGNTAARVLVNGTLEGPHATNERLSQIPQIPHTRLIPLDATRFYMGNTTARESLYILEQLMAQRDNYSDYIKELLVTNIFTDIGVKSQLAGNDYIILVNKIGQLNDPDGSNRHDVGIIYNTRTHKSYGFSYLTTSPYNGGATPVKAEESLKNMGRYYLRFAGDKVKHHAMPQPRTSSEPVEQGRILY